MDDIVPFIHWSEIEIFGRGCESVCQGTGPRGLPGVRASFGTTLEICNLGFPHGTLGDIMDPVPRRDEGTKVKTFRTDGLYSGPEGVDGTVFYAQDMSVALPLSHQQWQGDASLKKQQKLDLPEGQI